MKYLLLIYTDEKREASLSENEQMKMIEAYQGLEADLGKTKVKLAGEALQPTTTATTVRVRGGKTQTMDGPFAETKEQLGGFYLLDCPNLDQALAWAAKIPSARDGSIEVRPIMSFG